jgi:hypothetical protein
VLRPENHAIGNIDDDDNDRLLRKWVLMHTSGNTFFIDESIPSRMVAAEERSLRGRERLGVLTVAENFPEEFSCRGEGKAKAQGGAPLG